MPILSKFRQFLSSKKCYLEQIVPPFLSCCGMYFIKKRWVFRL